MSNELQERVVAAVAEDYRWLSDGEPPRFLVTYLPGSGAWFLWEPEAEFLGFNPADTDGWPSAVMFPGGRRECFDWIEVTAPSRQDVEALNLAFGSSFRFEEFAGR